MKFTEDDLLTISDSLLDSISVALESAGMWKGRGREKYFRDEAKNLLEISQRIKKTIKELQNEKH